MLKVLNVENYALIDRLNIDFSEGMSIITGETGAGKSILLGALTLVLGGRADVNVLKDRERNCVVEACFFVKNCNIESLLEQNEIDYEDELIVRRTISPAGKSRAFINDIPVNAAVLRDTGDKLLDIHSQHKNLLLSNSKFQLSVIDAITDFGELKNRYKECFKTCKSEEKKLEELLALNSRAKADYDYIKSRFDQLKQANLKDGEQDELELEIQKLSNIEELKSGYERLSTLLSSDEISIINMLKEADGLLKRLSLLHHASGETAKRIDDCLLEIRDISEEVERINSSLDIDPERLTVVENRLNTIYDLLQKHRVKSVAELLEIQASYEKSLIETDNLDETIAAIQKSVNENFEQVKTMAAQISELRQKNISHIENHVCNMLKSLGMPNAVFKVQLDKSSQYSADGIDEILFLFSANKDMPPKEISKVVSGGEMSRLMLSLKSLLVQGMALPTIIFDEIDTGISGEVADKMGDIIKEMSNKTQVINITHLPQIAAKGDKHYRVYKEDTETATYTKMNKLSKDERITEIAKMLSGSKITDAAIKHAKELLKYSQN
ncbi:MAG: DNA repair protein RecN [Prevotellaceae bacterium]|jgi:DNA repair protein RecN (Recombination protein N)|nr:DNA repair protein RecN [Prevotellaceae bacterium]